MQSITQKSNQQDLAKNYQKSIATIQRERRNILNALNEKYKERKYLNESQDNSLKSRPSQSESQDNPRKMVKLSVQMQSQNVKLAQKQPKQDKITQNQQAQNPKAQKKQQIPQSITDRNKRIFGGLTSYLKKAGQHLKSKQSKEKQRTTKQILNKVINKEKQQRQQVLSRQREELESQIKKLEKEKKEVEGKLVNNENMMLGEVVKGHLGLLGRFNITRNEPRICWKPTKPLLLAQKQQKLQQSTQKYLNRLSQQWLSTIHAVDNEVSDHSNYMTQNQRQFYGNLIGRMFRDCEGFVLTSAEPQVFWRAKGGVEGRVKETRDVLRERCLALKRANQDFYLMRKQHNNEDELAKQILNQQQNYDFDQISQKPTNQ